jgi:hypothetical protein
MNRRVELLWSEVLQEYASSPSKIPTIDPYKINDTVLLKSGQFLHIPPKRVNGFSPENKGIESYSGHIHKSAALHDDLDSNNPVRKNR